MLTLKKLAIDKKYGKSAIAESFWFNATFPTGKMVVSGIFSCFAKNPVGLNYSFDKDRLYPVFYAAEINREAAYLRIEIKDEPITDFLPLSTLNGKSIETWKNWDQSSSSFFTECHFSFLDSSIMDFFNHLINNEYKGDYTSFVDNYQYVIDDFRYKEQIEIPNVEYTIPFVYTPNSESTAFAALNKNKEIVSIVIDFGTYKNRTY